MWWNIINDLNNYHLGIAESVFLLSRVRVISIKLYFRLIADNEYTKFVLGTIH